MKNEANVYHVVLVDLKDDVTRRHKIQTFSMKKQSHWSRFLFIQSE